MRWQNFFLTLLGVPLLLSGSVLFACLFATDPWPNRGSVLPIAGAVFGVTLVLSTLCVVSFVRAVRSGVPARRIHINPWIQVGAGLAIAVAGIGGTMSSWSNAARAGGGTYTIFWGIIVVGLYQAIRGGFALPGWHARRAAIRAAEEARLKEARLEQPWLYQ